MAAGLPCMVTPQVAEGLPREVLPAVQACATAEEFANGLIESLNRARSGSPPAARIGQPTVLRCNGRRACRPWSRYSARPSLTSLPDLLRPGNLMFCRACGCRLAGVPPMQCASCGFQHWNDAKPCASALVVKDSRVLLVRRAREPWKGCWDVPGGFCESKEHPVCTAEREVFEETGLRIRVVGFLGIWLDEYPAATRSPNWTLNLLSGFPGTRKRRAWRSIGGSSEIDCFLRPPVFPRRWLSRLVCRASLKTSCGKQVASGGYRRVARSTRPCRLTGTDRPPPPGRAPACGK